MAVYMVLARSFLHQPGAAAPAVIEPGDVIEFSGTPGSSLAPMDRDAMEAKKAAIAASHPYEQSFAARWQKRWRACLQKRALKQLASAQAELSRLAAQWAPTVQSMLPR